jgi:hypothetical protein
LTTPNSSSTLPTPARTFSVQTRKSRSRQVHPHPTLPHLTLLTPPLARRCSNPGSSRPTLMGAQASFSSQTVTHQATREGNPDQQANSSTMRTRTHTHSSLAPCNLIPVVVSYFTAPRTLFSISFDYIECCNLCAFITSSIPLEKPPEACFPNEGKVRPVSCRT